MPFESEAQEKFMWAKHPKIAKDWAKRYGSILRKKAAKCKEITEKALRFNKILHPRYPKGHTKGGQFIPKSGRVFSAMPVARKAIPVSRAITFRKSLVHVGTNAGMQTAVRAIDQVHKDGNLPPIRMTAGIPWRYRQARGMYDSHSNRIYINNSNPTPHLTSAHELGHALSFRGKPGKRLSSEAVGLMRAIDNSPTTRQWRSWEKSGQIATSRGKIAIPSTYFKYFNSREEQWARAYAQYITYKSRNANLRRDLQYNQRSTIKTQWDDKEFAPIAREFDTYFRSLGWMP